METMRNFIENENGRNWLVFEADNGAEVDTAALGMLEYNDAAGLLPFNITRYNSTVTAKTDISDYISVSELLRGTADRELIVSLTETILRVFEEAEDFLINTDSVIMDTDFMFCDTCTGKVHMCINPFVNENAQQMSPAEFLRDFICRVRFDRSENCEYIGKILGFLNSSDEFSITEFRKIVNSQNTSDNVSEKTCAESDEVINAEKTVKSDESDAPEKTNFLSSLDCFADEDEPAEEEKRKGIFSKLFGEGKRKTKPGKAEDDNYDDMLMSGFCEESGEFIIPASDSNETVLLKKSPEKKKAYLVRVNSNEKIEITSGRFRIGADSKSVDYCISDNCAVSRVHAAIVRKTGGYYITDCNSTNHTFVNDQQIRSRKETRIYDNSRITLADEEFTFILNHS